MSEEMRAEFEAWVKSFIGVSWLTRDKLRDGEYSDDGTQFMWDAWQASRAALVVELPDSTGCGPAYHEAICDVTCSLDDAGVGYK